MNILSFAQKKQLGEKISMVTCYDYPSASLLAQTDIDCLLVGDSVAMVMHGFESTIHASVEMMWTHTEAVSRAKPKQFIVTDLPFLAHRMGKDAVFTAAKCLLQAGAQALKIEGADQETLAMIKSLVTAGIPIMGHIGLQPQSILSLGQYRVQGRDASEGKALINAAEALQAAGAFALVIECVPAELAAKISRHLQIPCIGIGAGIDTDGQVLVWHDLLGLHLQKLPKFVKQYASLGHEVIKSLNAYHAEVKEVVFPEEKHTYKV
jgi:3-methyl-2-oxobutanoate hydroxymethyltransferase